MLGSWMCFLMLIEVVHPGQLKILRSVLLCKPEETPLLMAMLVKHIKQQVILQQFRNTQEPLRKSRQIEQLASLSRLFMVVVRMKVTS